jgi:hypothetical protein
MRWYEEQLTNPDFLKEAYYHVDQPAESPEERLQLGLPRERIIPRHGNQLHEKGIAINGLTTTYYYKAKNFAPFLPHKDELRTGAIIYIWQGQKNCRIVAPAHCERFEQACLDHSPYFTRNCEQFVKQSPCWLPERLLNNWGIRYTDLEANAGEFVYLFGEAYHWGFNNPDCCSEAENFAPANWDLKGFLLCNEACPPGSVTELHPQKRKAVSSVQSNKPSKSRRKSNSPLPSHDSMKVLSTIGRPDSFLRLHRVNEALSFSLQPPKTIEETMTALDRLEKSMEIGKLLRRVFLVQLKKSYEAERALNWSGKSSVQALDSILDTQFSTASRRDAARLRDRLKDRLRLGKYWYLIDRDYPGLYLLVNSTISDTE